MAEAVEAASSGDDDAERRRRRRVLMFPLPFQGHITPMLQLADVLRERGRFDVTVFHAAVNAFDRVRHPGEGAWYRSVTVGAGVPDALAAIVPAGTGGDFAGFILRMNELLRAPFEDSLREVLAEDEGVACLVVDSNFRGMQEVAERLGVPTLSLRTGGAACLVAYMAVPELCDKGVLPPPSRVPVQLDMPVPGLPPLLLRDMLFSATSRHDTMATSLQRIVESGRRSSGVIINTFADLEDSDLQKITNGLNVPVYAIGPLHKISAGLESSMLAQDRSCLEWLDRQEPGSVLYVSFGSLASMDPEELQETAWGLANSQAPFLWVIRPNLVHSSSSSSPPRPSSSPSSSSSSSSSPPSPSSQQARFLLPGGFEEATRGRGMVVAWAPQQDVLKHRAVGGFWTHNGWNSTLESISDGVPMICRPQFADQMINARYVQEVWKVGFELEGKLERGMVERAVRKLLCEEEEGGEMRQRAEDLKNRAAECIQKGGSTEAAIDMLVNLVMSL